MELLVDMHRCHPVQNYSSIEQTLMDIDAKKIHTESNVSHHLLATCCWLLHGLLVQKETLNILR